MTVEVPMSLDDRMDQWVDAGILTSDQAEAIRTFEAAQSTRGNGRDVLAYLGAVLVLASALVVTAEIWPELDHGGQAIVAGVAALLLTVVGEALSRSTQASTERVGNASLLLGTVAVGMTVTSLAQMMGLGAEASVLTGLVAAVIYAVMFYVRRPSTAQHVALFGAGFGTVMYFFAEVLSVDAGVAPGALSALFGLSWLWLSTTRRLAPQVTGEILGILAIGFGSFLTVMELNPTDAAGRFAMVISILAATGLVTAGVLIDRTTYIVGGVLMLVVYIPWLIIEVLGGGLGAPFALLAGGALLLAAAMYLNRRARSR
ncbi:MAG: DUF2157 domain-containing protein [Acidimicrobiia bacterium]